MSLFTDWNFHPKTETKNVCEWILAKEDNFYEGKVKGWHDTECGFSYDADGVSLSMLAINFCPFCGGKIKEVKE